MAQINLNPGESFTVVGGTNTFSGSTMGGETVFISGGINTFTPDFNAGGDRIVLSGSASQYTVARSGSSVIFRGPNGIVVTFPAPNPNLAADRNPVISFTSGGDYVLDSTPAGTFTLSNGASVYVITNNPGTIIIEPSAPIFVKVVANDTSPDSGTVAFTFTLTQPYVNVITFTVTPLGGSAIPGVDYVGFAQTLTFAPGETVKTVTYAAVADTIQEGDETIVLQITSSVNIVASGTAGLTATIGEFETFDFSPATLRVGADSYPGGSGNYFGSLTAGQVGKLLAADDVIVGSGAGSIIRVTDTDGRSAIDDADFTGVVNVGTLQTNFTTIRLGTQADRAGIVAIQTQFLTDSNNLDAAGPVQGGALLEMIADANADGVADFDNPVAVSLSSSGIDTVRLTLQSASAATIDTGMTFKPGNGPAIGPIDRVEIVGQANPVHITLAPGDVGNGTPYEAGTQVLSVRVQATDAVGVLIGGGARFDDEGIRFTGATFVVDNGASLSGGFGEVILGTGLADVLTASSAGAAYIVGGLGDDRITGGAGADTLIGGGGRDVFAYTAASLSRGAAYDSIADFAYGSDVIDLPGATRSVARVAGGPLNAATLDDDLTALLGTALTAGGAALVTAIAGTLSGATFLIADGNGVAGYQAGEDFVIWLPDPPTTLPGVFVI